MIVPVKEKSFLQFSNRSTWRKKKSDLHLELLLQPPLGFSHFLGAVSMTKSRGNQDYQWEIRLGSAHQG